MRLLNRLLNLFAGAVFVVSLVAASGQTLAHKGWVGSGITVEPWWAGAVLYQIDPVSFQDSKGDGFGDLQGITQRLDYVQSLGVDAIVLSPFQLQRDFGRNSRGPAFDPKYGTEEDLDHVIQEASRRKIRIFVDLPVTPDRSTPELVNVARFWLSRGIAGLRLTPGPRSTAMTPAQIVDRLRELRKLAATFAGQRVLFWDMAEPLPRLADGGVSAYRRPRRSAAPQMLDGPQMMIDSHLASMSSFRVEQLRNALANAPGTSTASGSVSVPVSDGTDRRRSLDRFGDGAHTLEIAKVLATALLTSRGAPLLYFGQEIGMATSGSGNGSQVASVEPSPMQWGGDVEFTTGVPWMEMGSNSSTANVAIEDADWASLLNWYRRLSALHHENAALRVGTMDVIAETNPDIVAWVRRPREPGSLTAPVVVVCNVTGRPLLVSVAADLRRVGVTTSSPMMHTLASTALTVSSAGLGTGAKDAVSGPVSMNAISLPPYGIYIGELAHPPGLESAPSPLRRGAR